MIVCIDNLDIETNIRNNNGIRKTKAEFLYEITLQSYQPDSHFELRHDLIIKDAITLYNKMNECGIIQEVK